MCARVNKPRETYVSGAGIALLLFVYKVFGQRVCRCFIAAVIFFAYPFLRPARQASAAFRKQWEQFTSTRCISSLKHLRTFAYTLADRLACRAGLFRFDQVRVCTPEATESLTALYRQGKGVFCIVSHLGCFDMLRVLFDSTREGMAGEIHVFMDSGATQAFVRCQKRYGGAQLENLVHSVEELGPALSMEMAQKLDEGAMLVMAGDRIWRDSDAANYEFSFLGRPAWFPRGCFRWAAAMKVPVYSLCLAENGGKYDLHVECLSARGEIKAEPLAEAFVASLEKLCCRYPANWFNFYHFWK